MRLSDSLLCLALLALAPARAALLSGGGWFEPLGEAQECLLDPSEPCPYADMGPSGLEQALRGNGFSELKLSQRQGENWDWDGGQARTGRADMDFRMLVSAPLRSAAGLALYSPWPALEWTRGPDSARLYQIQPSTYASVLLGWDLLSVRRESRQQLLLQAELPIAYGPGLWRVGGEYLPWPNWRLRGGYAQASPREEIAHWTGEKALAKLKYHERQIEGENALRLGPLEMAAGLRWAWLDALERPATFTRSGTIATVYGQANWLRRDWAWRNRFQAQYRDLADSYSGLGGDSLAMDGIYDLYMYHSRLQRTFANRVRLGLQAETRLLRGYKGSTFVTHPAGDSLGLLASTHFNSAAPASQRLRTSLYGADLRWWLTGMYIDAGGDYALAYGSGQTSSLLAFGDTLATSQLLAREHMVLRAGIGFAMDGGIYSYSYRQAFPLGTDKGIARPGASHRFEISGSF